MEPDSTIPFIETSSAEEQGFKVLSQEIKEETGNPLSKILVIENDTMSAFLINTILQRKSVDFQLITTENEVQDELKNKHYKLILVGINEPENYDLFRQLEEGISERSNTVIVALTTVLTKKTLTSDQIDQFDHILKKPYDITDLCKLISPYKNDQGSKKIIEKAPEPQKYSFNLEQLEQVSNNNQEFISKMLDKFLTTALEAEESMETGLIVRDWVKIKKTSHKCIPSYSVLGLHKLVEYLEYIESNIPENNESNTLQEKIEIFIAENKNVIAEINKYLEH